MTGNTEQRKYKTEVKVKIDFYHTSRGDLSDSFTLHNQNYSHASLLNNLCRRNRMRKRCVIIEKVKVRIKRVYSNDKV